ncbi:hypothetical protein B0H19DRAFT_605372 [Mycena capillaripes]|nr:hypothetical protein B0H19DRAFT_605372 [Mycena capillaripes]
MSRLSPPRVPPACPAAHYPPLEASTCPAPGVRRAASPERVASATNTHAASPRRAHPLRPRRLRSACRAPLARAAHATAALPSPPRAFSSSEPHYTIARQRGFSSPAPAASDAMIRLRAGRGRATRRRCAPRPLSSARRRTTVQDKPPSIHPPCLCVHREPCGLPPLLGDVDPRRALPSTVVPLACWRSVCSVYIILILFIFFYDSYIY